MDKLSGWAAGRPRRLRMLTDKPPSPAVRASRKGAGDGAEAWASGRHRQVKVDRPSAATCRRRSAWAPIPASGQASTPAKPPLLSNCSQHQATCLPARMMTSLSSARPAAAQAGACGNQGGATRASQPPSADKRARAGKSKVISPRPLRSARISVRAPRGQPPPGSSSSSTRWPLGSARSGGLARVSPRQTSPLASTPAKASGNGMALMTRC